jgi:hypothetical protein
MIDTKKKGRFCTHPSFPLQPLFLKGHLHILRCNGVTQGQKSLGFRLHFPRYLGSRYPAPEKCLLPILEETRRRFPSFPQTLRIWRMNSPLATLLDSPPVDMAPKHLSHALQPLSEPEKTPPLLLLLLLGPTGLNSTGTTGSRPRVSQLPIRATSTPPLLVFFWGNSKTPY